MLVSGARFSASVVFLGVDASLSVCASRGGDFREHANASRQTDASRPTFNVNAGLVACAGNGKKRFICPAERCRGWACAEQ